MTKSTIYTNPKFWEILLGKRWAEVLVEPLTSIPDLTERMKMLSVTLDNPENVIYPSKQNIFKAFRVCPEEQLKVVFVGQDPYLNEKATGLCFANPRDLLRKEWSPHLKVIQDSLERLFPGNAVFMDPSLEHWANQGVLCLNASLTSSPRDRARHISFWLPIVSTILNTISKRGGIVFVLFGRIAQTLRPSIQDGNLIIQLENPGLCALRNESLNLDFIDINEYLFEKYGEGISWVQLPF